MTITSAESVRIAAEVLGGLAVRNAPLGSLTTYRVGGHAALRTRISNATDIDLVARAVKLSGIEVLVVGLGSNILVADSGFDGLVVELGDAYADIAITGTTVRAGGAARLPVVSRRTVAESLTGFEWAVGIPGSVGGAVRMNAGGHGSEISNVLSRVHLADLSSGEHGEVPVEQLELTYRHSALRPTQIVLWAEFELERGEKTDAEQRLSEIVRWRHDHQPGGANAGSVFTNPPGDSAGRLIEACGAKGLRIGSAQVSAKHANFIQADDGGSANDVFDLMVAVRHRVAETFGVDLECETRLVGFGDSAAAMTANPQLRIEGS